MLIKEAISKVSIQLEQKSQQAIFDCDEEIFVNAERSAIEQVILNVLTNSIRYTKEDGVIDVSAVKQDGEVIIKVKDNGIGISKDNIKRIFDKFYRVHTGNVHDVKGSGLGLAYVKQIVQAHRGTIRAESELGAGTTFIIVLPLK
jgi:signal transduction histidine kinase